MLCLCYMCEETLKLVMNSVTRVFSYNELSNDILEVFLAGNGD